MRHSASTTGFSLHGGDRHAIVFAETRDSTRGRQVIVATSRGSSGFAKNLFKTKAKGVKQ
jgi:hypothetical protein